MIYRAVYLRRGQLHGEFQPQAENISFSSLIPEQIFSKIFPAQFLKLQGLEISAWAEIQKKLM